MGGPFSGSMALPVTRFLILQINGHVHSIGLALTAMRRQRGKR